MTRKIINLLFITLVFPFIGYGAMSERDIKEKCSEYSDLRICGTPSELYEKKQAFSIFLSDNYKKIIDTILPEDFLIMLNRQYDVIATYEDKKINEIMNYFWERPEIDFSKTVYYSSCSTELIWLMKDWMVKKIPMDHFIYSFMIPYTHHTTQRNVTEELAMLDFALQHYDGKEYIRISGSDFRPFVQNSTERLDALQKFGLICRDEEMEELRQAGLVQLLFNGEEIVKQKYKNLRAEEGSEPKIPYIIHHISLIDSLKPKEIDADDLENVLATKKKFEESGIQWKHIVWSNKPELMPKSKSVLIQAGIELRSIYEYSENIRLFYLVDDLITKKRLKRAENVLQYGLINHFGGIYSDLDYVFTRHTLSEHHKYHFYAITGGRIYVEDSMFGSMVGHPVIDRTLKFVEENLTNPPGYISTIKQAYKLTEAATVSPLSLAYYSQANKYQNVDVIYPQIHYYSLPKEEKNKIMDSDYDVYGSGPFWIDGHVFKNRGQSGSEAFNKLLDDYCGDDFLSFSMYKKFLDTEVCAAESLYTGYKAKQWDSWPTDE